MSKTRYVSGQWSVRPHCCQQCAGAMRTALDSVVRGHHYLCHHATEARVRRQRPRTSLGLMNSLRPDAPYKESLSVSLSPVDGCSARSRSCFLRGIQRRPLKVGPLSLNPYQRVRHASASLELGLVAMAEFDGCKFAYCVSGIITLSGIRVPVRWPVAIVVADVTRD